MLSKIASLIRKATNHAIGRRTQLTDTDHTTSQTSTYRWQYDNENRVTHNITEPAGAEPFELQYTYDADSRLTALQDSRGHRVETDYDRLGRMKQRRWNSPGLPPSEVSWQYNALGKVTRIQRKTASTLISQTDYLYNPQTTWLDELTHTGPGGELLERTTYQRDETGTILSETRLDDSLTYSRDANGQLGGVARQYGPDEEFFYDPAGNPIEITREGQGTQAHLVGPANRTTTAGDWEQQFDSEGNLTQRTNPTTGETWHYRYDHLNALLSATLQNSSGTTLQEINYQYDPFGRRVAQQSASEPATRFQFTGFRLWSQQTSTDTGSTYPHYLYGREQDELLALSTHDGSSPTARWVLNDRQSTPRRLLSPSGATVGQADYSLYGERILASGEMATFAIGYTGRELDLQTGLLHYRTRAYDPARAQFLSEDRARFLGGDFNLRRYVNNRPTDATDPFGTQTLVEYRWLYPPPLGFVYLEIPCCCWEPTEDDKPDEDLTGGKRQRKFNSPLPGVLAPAGAPGGGAGFGGKQSNPSDPGPRPSKECANTDKKEITTGAWVARDQSKGYDKKSNPYVFKKSDRPTIELKPNGPCGIIPNGGGGEKASPTEGVPLDTYANQPPSPGNTSGGGSGGIGGGGQYVCNPPPEPVIDIDVDSDNTTERDKYPDPLSGLYFPFVGDLSKPEDEAEDSSASYFMANVGDKDNNGTSNWADGYANPVSTASGKTPGTSEKFDVLRLALAVPARATVFITFNYSASDPMLVTAEGPAPGRYRIWKKNGNAFRNGTPTSASGGGGDWIKPGVGYTPSALGDGTLYVETVPQPFSGVLPVAGKKITAEAKVTFTFGGQEITKEVDDTVKVDTPKITLSWETYADNTPLDKNPNWEHGKRIFPDATTPDDTKSRNKVKLKVSAPVDKGTKIYLKAFDVDDPTPDEVGKDDNGNVDPEDTEEYQVGNDNHGEEGGHFEETETEDITLVMADGGVAKTESGKEVIFLTTMQPGDNFRVAADFNKESLNGLQVDNSEEPNYVTTQEKDTEISFIPVTPMLTVWRSLWVEIDSMGPAPTSGPEKNFDEGIISAYTDNGDGTSTLQLNVSLTDENNRYEYGLIWIQDVGTFEVISNTHVFNSGDRVVIKGNPGMAVFTKQFRIYDDDVVDLSGIDPGPQYAPRSMPYRLSGGNLIYSAFADAYILPEYAPSEYIQNDVPYRRNLSSSRAIIIPFLQQHNQLTSREDMWSVYVLACWQPDASIDGDPDPLGGYSMGLTQNYNNSLGPTLNLSSIYVEELRENETVSENIRSQEEHVLVHEIGHQGDGEHEDFGIMKEGAPTDQNKFKPITINRFRKLNEY